jgi:hypothetical protein
MLNLVAVKFRFTIQAISQLSLPVYKGSVLRGGFGKAFFEIACSRRMRIEECDPSCRLDLSHTCTFAKIYKPSAPKGTPEDRPQGMIHEPYILEPPEDPRTEFKPGEELQFNLILIGWAINYLHYFITAFQELGINYGIGEGNKNGLGRFRLIRVESIGLGEEKPIMVFDGEQLINQYIVITRLSGLKPDNAINSGPLIIDFQTMTRMVVNKIPVEIPIFNLFIRALLRRLSNLEFFYPLIEGVRNDCLLIKEKANRLVKEAEAICLVANQTHWEISPSHSVRTNLGKELTGLVGRAIYEGPWGEFLPYLQWGELLHVGKAVTFGMGKYRILFESE